MHTFPHGIYVLPQPILPNPVIAKRRIFNYCPESFLALSQRLLRPLALGDVTEGDSHYRPLPCFDGAERYLHREFAAILAQTPPLMWQFLIGQRRAGKEARAVFGPFFTEPLRHEVQKGLS